MKATKLMLGMAVAALSFAACNKQETTPVQFDGNKSVTLNIANALQTKSAGTQVAEGTAVQLNSFQVFFSDGTTLYTPKTVTADTAAVTYFTAQEADQTYEFHFLPKAVSKVIVVGNMPKSSATTEAALLAEVEALTVAAQQDPTKLRLIGIDDSLTPVDSLHTNTDNAAIQHPDPYVHADVNLVPAVARFEVVAYEYAQLTVAEGKTAPARNYSEMVVNNLSINNYYTDATIDFAGAVTPANLVNATGLDKDNIYGTYFTKLAENVWSNDKVDVTLKADTYVKADDEKTCHYYQVFPGAVPQFLMSLTGKENGVSSPLYLMTSALKNGTAALTTVEAGKVYRMTMKFDDSNLQAPEKCVEVNIKVEDWNVIVVTPEFN